MGHTYASSQWGALKAIQIPSFVFRRGSLRLGGAALSVYVALLLRHKKRMRILREKPEEKDGSVVAGRTILARHTDFGETQLHRAIRELNALGFVRVERRYRDGRRGTIRGSLPSRYVFLRVEHDSPVSLVTGVNPALEMTEYGTNLAVANGLTYFTLPEVVVTMRDQAWSLARLSSAETKLYVALLWKAGVFWKTVRSNTFDVIASNLRLSLAIRDTRTFNKALTHLESVGLLSLGESDGADFTVTLNDPTTGEPVRRIEDSKSDPANYRIGSSRFVLNQGSDEDREKLVRSFLKPFAPTVKQGNGDLAILCPYHADKNPSCNVSFRLRCFQCFACEAKGTFSELLTKLKSGDGEAAMYQIAARRGQKVSYRDPDKDVVATYEYKNGDGKLLRQVLRLTDDSKGRRRFRQRRPGKYGWIRDIRGVPKTLYHLELLPDADVVIVTEGERDADAITNCGMRSGADKSERSGWVDGSKRVIAVTSGNAKSWKPQFVDALKGKRVVVMPDADEAGAGYRDGVIGSLESAGIEYRVVEFAQDGCNDVSDFLQTHSTTELAERIGADWVQAAALPGRLYTQEDIML